MKPIQIINNDYTDRLHIGFVIGTTCNFKCHYCFEGCNDGKYRFPTDLNLIKKNLEYVINLYRKKLNKKHVRIHITGGEPTLWPDLGEFVEYFSKQVNCKISLSTNGTRTLRFWKEYGGYFDDIGISIHNERIDPYHIINVMDEIYNTHPGVLVNGTVLMDPYNWDRCVEIADILNTHPTPWLLKVRPVLFDGEMKNFTTEQLDYMRQKVTKTPPEDRVSLYKELGTIQSNKPNIIVKTDTDEEIEYNTFNFLENNWQHFEGWQCNLGIDRFAIERDGSIQGACGMKTLFKLESAFNIYDPELEDKFTADIIKPTICKQAQCLCATDIRMSKQII